MSYDTFPLTPQDVAVETSNYRNIETRFESGDVQIRNRWPRERRVWTLSWSNMSQAEVEVLRGFVQAHNGDTDYFYFSAYEKVASPIAGPILRKTDGGSAIARSLWIKYTWGDGTNETLPSNARATTISAGQLITANVPYFPAGANRARIYASGNGTTYHRQTDAITLSGGAWTEPLTGYVATGVSPPTTNGLAENALVRLSVPSFETTKLWLDSYSAVLDLEEVA
jgi:hypothetical protein